MKPRSPFFRGVFVAAILALAATLAVSGLALLASAPGVIRLVVPAICGAYIVLFLRGQRIKTGRIVTVIAWLSFSVAAWWGVASLPFYLLLHAGAIWLVRCLYAYSSLLPALADFVLTAFSAAAFSWALARSGSVFLATWCFFLLQALWTCIPTKTGKYHLAEKAVTPNRFESAKRRADAAIRQLAAR